MSFDLKTSVSVRGILTIFDWRKPGRSKLHLLSVGLVDLVPSILILVVV